MMNDPVFVDMIYISGTFLTIAFSLVASILWLEKNS
jgi:hypothetical protein